MEGGPLIRVHFWAVFTQRGNDDTLRRGKKEEEQPPIIAHFLHTLVARGKRGETWEESPTNAVRHTIFPSPPHMGKNKRRRKGALAAVSIFTLS